MNWLIELNILDFCYFELSTDCFNQNLSQHENEWTRTSGHGVNWIPSHMFLLTLALMWRAGGCRTRIRGQPATPAPAPASQRWETQVSGKESKVSSMFFFHRDESHDCCLLNSWSTGRCTLPLWTRFPSGWTTHPGPPLRTRSPSATRCSDSFPVWECTPRCGCGSTTECATSWRRSIPPGTTSSSSRPRDSSSSVRVSWMSTRAERFYFEHLVHIKSSWNFSANESVKLPHRDKL